MGLSKSCFRAISLMARMTGRLAEHESARAQEAAYLASAQNRLEESGRLAAQLREQNPVSPPMGPPRRAEQISGTTRLESNPPDDVNAVPTTIA